MGYPRDSHVYHHTCQSYVSILSYCPTWDIGRTSKGFPCVPLTCQCYVSILSYCPTWDIGRTSQGFPCVPLTCQSYVFILSYCPTWDIGGISQGLPCAPPHMSILCVYPVPLSYVGCRWDIPETPMCTITHVNPMCLSYCPM